MRNGFGTVSETGSLARPREGFARFELRGRRSTFARSSVDFVAGAALSQHFRKVKYRFRGRRSTFASTLCELGDGKMQKTLALCVNWASGLCANHLGCDACTAAVSERSRNGFGSRGLKIATFKYESSTRSQLSQLGLENRNF